MEVISKGKFIRVSPKKARSIASVVRGKNASEALIMLNSLPQKSAGVIAKVLKSAMANAENNFNLEKSELVLTKITVDNGPVLKRYRPRAKGMASSIKKRTSHITIIVSGDIKTKNTEKTEKEKHETEIKENKIRYEKPEQIKSEKAVPKVEVKNTIFRRKTG